MELREREVRVGVFNFGFDESVGFTEAEVISDFFNKVLPALTLCFAQFSFEHVSDCYVFLLIDEDHSLTLSTIIQISRCMKSLHE